MLPCAAPGHRLSATKQTRFSMPYHPGSLRMPQQARKRRAQSKPMISHLFGRITAEQPNTASKFSSLMTEKTLHVFCPFSRPLRLYYTSFYHNIRTFHLISGECYRSSFYIKTQLWSKAECNTVCCIASSFYIKPQQTERQCSRMQSCIASSFYIKPQPSGSHLVRDWCCIASSFYIKPQLRNADKRGGFRCIASSFYIKPQRPCRGRDCRPGCIASSFYIKPQP